MKTKRFCYGLLVMMLVFLANMVGCSTTTPVNYYNLGNVSENNSSFIVVSPIYSPGENDFRINDLIIDGQRRSINQWRSPSSFMDSVTYDAKAIVRVTPGEHTFSITFLSGTVGLIGVADGNQYQTNNTEISMDIKYNCLPNKGYIFSFSARRESEHPLSMVIVTIKILEGDLTDIENYGAISFNSYASTSIKEVASKTERMFVNFLSR